MMDKYRNPIVHIFFTEIGMVCGSATFLLIGYCSMT